MKRVFVVNGGTRFYIIDRTDEALLLQRVDDGEIVIARGYKFETHGYAVVWWQHGSYFGHNLLGAVKAFYGEEESENGE